MTAPQERPRPRRAERRQRVLAQAQHLFAAQGYSATSLAQVAAAAGLSEAMLQRSYPDRAALFADLLDEVLHATLRSWARQTAALSDPLARLHALAERFLAATADEGEMLRAVARTTAEGPTEVQAALRAFAREWEEYLAGLIAQGQQSGFFRRSLDPRVGAWQLIHTALGCTVTLPLGVPLHAQAGYAAQAVECALHCLLKTDI